MKEKQEHAADVSAELRALARSTKTNLKDSVPPCVLLPTIYGKPIDLYFEELADRVDAAACVEAEEMRDALKDLVDVILKCDAASPLWWHCGAKGVKPLKCAKDIIARTLRNGEVGTEKEREERFDEFCKSQEPNCYGCPLEGKGLECMELWEKMPYKKGGAE